MLIEGYEEAHYALNQAVDAFCKVEFNARDYYPIEDGWTDATAWRRSMREKLNEVSEYLEKHMTSIQDQQDERER